jgi:hypothetical protein
LSNPSLMSSFNCYTTLAATGVPKPENDSRFLRPWALHRLNSTWRSWRCSSTRRYTPNI